MEGDEFVVIGVTTPETATKPTLKTLKGNFYRSNPEVNKVIEEVQAKARAEGKDYKHYVVLAHLVWIPNPSRMAWFNLGRSLV